MTEREEKEKRILTGTENVIYNSPNLGLQLIFGLLTNFMIIFYVNVMQQSPFYIGSINSLFLILGGFLNPMWGAIADRIHTRFGRKKTLILFSTPLVAITQILIWSPPVLLNE